MSTLSEPSRLAQSAWNAPPKVVQSSCAVPGSSVAERAAGAAVGAASKRSLARARAENGLKYFDLEEGSGSAEVSPGDKVTVHFDCYYGVVDVVSSRYATLLGKNEIIPEARPDPPCAPLTCLLTS